MELLIAMAVTVVYYLVYENKKPKSCDLHAWVCRNEGGNEYMVCETCGLLPGSGMTITGQKIDEDF